MKIFNKKLFVLVAFLSVISFYYSSPIKQGLYTFTNSINLFFGDTYNSILEFKYNHFNQAQHIKEQSRQLKELKQKIYLINYYKKELDKLEKFQFLQSDKLVLVRTTSLVNLSNNSQVWLEGFEKFNKEKIYALIYNGFAAGIAYAKSNKLEGLMLNNKSTSFTVYIGDIHKIGIIFGAKNGMIVKYMPLDYKVKIGDFVYTNGLDGVFIDGIKVGKVTKILKHNDYQDVEVKPFVDFNNPDYFYLIDN